MSEAVAELYTRLLHENLKQYAAWPVGSSLRLGDYGTIDGHTFKRIDNITTQFKIPCKDAISPVNLVFEYKSAGVAETKLNAGASVSIPGANISGSLKTELKFASNNSLYFRSIRLMYSHIDNFAEVSSAILEK